MVKISFQADLCFTNSLKTPVSGLLIWTTLHCLKVGRSAVLRQWISLVFMHSQTKGLMTQIFFSALNRKHWLQGHLWHTESFFLCHNWIHSVHSSVGNYNVEFFLSQIRYPPFKEKEKGTFVYYWQSFIIMSQHWQFWQSDFFSGLGDLNTTKLYGCTSYTKTGHKIQWLPVVANNKKFAITSQVQNLS